MRKNLLLAYYQPEKEYMYINKPVKQLAIWDIVAARRKIILRLGR